MHLRMKDKDYIPDGAGGFLTAQGGELILGQALFLLSARRGGFAPIPELGSRLYLLAREKPSAWETVARTYAQEALEPLGVTVTNAAVRQDNDGLRVEVEIQYQGEINLLEAVIR